MGNKKKNPTNVTTLKAEYCDFFPDSWKPWYCELIVEDRKFINALRVLSGRPLKMLGAFISRDDLRFYSAATGVYLSKEVHGLTPEERKGYFRDSSKIEEIIEYFSQTYGGPIILEE